MENRDSPKLFSKPWLTVALVAVLFIGALGIRLYDLTDLPNDFYLVRQYRSLLIARGMYYAHLPTAPEWQRDIAVAQWKAQGLIEPPIMESLAALTYHIIGEHIWVGRVFASLFWLAGGLAIWLLSKELFMREGGIIALAYFLFLPFGMTASWAFMPDSLMTALIAWSLWALYLWEKRRTWKTAILAGILTGLAILVKSVAVFPLLGAAVGLVLSRGSLKRILVDKQTWAVAAITAIPTVIYYFYGLIIVGTLGGQFALRFFPALLKDPSFYGRWLFTAAGISTFAAMFLSLAGILLFRINAPRFLIVGAWLGYIVFGFAFPYHFITHEYYHLPLIPIVAVGLIPVADLLVRQVALQKSWLPRAMFAGLLLFGVTMKIWEARNYMVSNQYRHEIAYWKELGQRIGYDKNIIELSGDYGCRLAYFGWVSGSEWSSNADEALRALAGQTKSDFATTFAEKISGKDLFVVTSPPEWENQPELREYLTAHYPLIDQGDGYWIFDLRP
ncbi:MAG: glycosyltransferase family 39 protein [Anaerolineales bacterium]|nr:glycosyltransferase family 39 protein [Anaerolineales bacterium]